MRNELELMRQFEVEELEERLEFSRWDSNPNYPFDDYPIGLTV